MAEKKYTNFEQIIEDYVAGKLEFLFVAETPDTVTVRLLKRRL